jgi:hypothetical protein
MRFAPLMGKLPFSTPNTIVLDPLVKYFSKVLYEIDTIA